MLSKEKFLLRRTSYALSTTIYVSPWASSWPRLYRQVFWLSDGLRTTERISLLLHKPTEDVFHVVEELTVSGYLTMQFERKVLTMDVELLKESFSMVAPRKEEFARSFYERLFTYYPDTKALFANTSMRRQESSLIATLATVISSAERGDNLLPTLQKLGKRHGNYGAVAEHYPLVGGVLLETFHEYLGATFTANMQEAWSQAFELISSQMLEGAKA